MKEGKTIRGVSLPVLIQDPAVAGETELRSIVHPVIVKDSAGFTEGPTCRRVAVVDLDFNSGKLRRPVPFSPRGCEHRGIAAYKVALPTKKGGARMPWARYYEEGVDIEELGSRPLDDRFMKVSVFGTVLLTLTRVQDPAVLGREIPWGFRGEQLLVVPRAAELDNAFYHRDSRSLQFYYSSSSPGQTVYSGLSQDIVVHETAHAIIDGIAPDLYDAISPESLAIHEGLADLTAALLSMCNREVAHKPGKPSNAEVFRQSGRFSRIAEEFGRWNGHGDALRDICNTKTLDTNAPADRRVDSSSPHSTSEVLSGLLFVVFCALYESAPNEPAIMSKVNRVGFYASEGLHSRLVYAVNRTLGIAYRGLDWLPPGDASFADLIAAMLAADREFFPDDPRFREVLSREAGLRGIPITEASQLLPSVKLPLNADARREFVELHREALGVPADARVKVTVRRIHIYAPPLLPKFPSIGPNLKPDMSRFWSTDTEHYLMKLAWWQREANDVEGWGEHRRYRSGASIIVEKSGRIRAVLQNRHAATAMASRSAFLHLMLAGESRRPQVGPDGVALRRGLRASLKHGTLSIKGAMQALHIAGDFE